LATRQPLTRETVLRAAVQLVDAEGLSALSMRTLGRQLGVEAMSIYNHVPNKDALLDGLVEVVLSDVGSRAEDWRKAIRELARGLREASLSHPEIFRLFATRRFTTLPGARPTEDILAALRRGGFDGAATVRAYRIVSSYLTGYLFGQLRAFRSPPLAESLEHLNPADYPVLHGLAAEIASVDRREEYERGLELILDALERSQVGRT
jgi:AcrR family transcriptional regulator